MSSFCPFLSTITRSSVMHSCMHVIYSSRGTAPFAGTRLIRRLQNDRYPNLNLLVVSGLLVPLRVWKKFLDGWMQFLESLVQTVCMDRLLSVGITYFIQAPGDRVASTIDQPATERNIHIAPGPQRVKVHQSSHALEQSAWLLILISF